MYRSTIIAFAFVAFAAPSSAADSAKETKTYKHTPWHLVDIWWDSGKDVPFESFSMDVAIRDDLPANVHVYVAPLGICHLDKTALYGGFQTQADGNTKRDQHLRGIGRGLICSMWGERSYDAIRPSIGGFCQSSGHEGDFISVRRPYEWAKGNYTYRLVKMETEKQGDKSFTWIGAFVYSEANDENVFIGALRAPGTGLSFNRKFASFVEIYGGVIPLSDIPKAAVTFGPVKINGQPVEIKSARAIYPVGVPEVAQTTEKEGRLTVNFGTMRAKPDQHDVKLLPTAGLQKP